MYNSKPSLAAPGSTGGWKYKPVIEKEKKENQRSGKCAFLMKKRCQFISLLQQRVKAVNKISKNLHENKTFRVLRSVRNNELQGLEGEVKTFILK